MAILSFREGMFFFWRNQKDLEDSDDTKKVILGDGMIFVSSPQMA